jgi:Bacteriophage clamp loader A subunit
MSNLYELINAINFKKDKFEDVTSEKSYPPYIVNRFLMQDVGTVLAANEMNKNSKLDKQLQYDFLKAIIPKGKRFTKHIKKEAIQEENSLILAKYYGVNLRRALEYLKLTSDKDLEKILYLHELGVDINSRKQGLF